MDYLTYSKRLNYLLELVEKGKLQSPDQLTNKFDCSERTVRKMINDLRELGHDIKYSRRTMKYSLEKD
ncbi:HTH domain-containing protein [Fulvivirga sp.]|uniref:HTH domain-containing protein n=1 Tax=Fulvivirga sp. TaxID=1931237 RepID=UPI0032EC8CDB